MQANLRHLYVFREVALRGSVSAAARSAYLSQPAITQAVAGVERFFGASLFQRSTAGMTLTAAGQACAQRIDSAFDQLRAGLAEISRPGKGGQSAIEHSITSAQLRAVLAVVEHGSFSLAARATGLSQPTIHRAARELEAAVGIRLFERTSYGIQPTREAETLARRVQLAFGEIAQAKAEVDTLRGSESGTTVIGAMPLARSRLVPSTILEFAGEHPEHGVSILEGSYDYLIAGLQKGEVDFLVGAMREPLMYEHVVQEHLFEDPLAIIMRAGHPLARRKRVPIGALLKYPWVAPRPNSPLRKHFNELFSAAGLPAPARTIDCNSLAAARALLLESDRLMLLSAHQIHYDLEAGLLHAMPHPNGNVTRSIGLTVRKDWRPTPTQARLLELLREHARAEMPRLRAPRERPLDAVR
jgi:LysR family transcriptional regulator of gallate degradation